jgi:glycine/D-amino acid oxidase-like deaminating enzyme
MNTKFLDLVILGGGILGTAVAAKASAAGMGVVLFRLNDRDRPRADTLRNQGWLQSGIMYPIHHFRDQRQYRLFALKTFEAGREMLEDCGLPIPGPGGIIGVNAPERIEDLKLKARLLNKVPQKAFRRLETDEARDVVGEWAEEGVEYYRIPDAPFDEAAVVNHLRDEALKNGAELVDLSAPAQLECRSDSIFVRYGEEAIEAPLTLVAAGAGSFDLMAQVGMFVEHTLHRTPLLVGRGACSMPADIFVDTKNGCSAVHHKCTDMEHGAVVVGTRVKCENAGFFYPDDRRIPPCEIEEMRENLHPGFERLLPGRYTAGYEVIPPARSGRTQYEPWIVDSGSVVFCSPGRATVALRAAQELVEEVLKPKSKSRIGGRATYTQSIGTPWQTPINMHFTQHYDFNDAENSNG